jgi:hypothetical protein
MTPLFHKKKPAAKSSGPTEKTEISEEQQVEERTAIGPHIVYEAIRREGEEELQRTSSALAGLGSRRAGHGLFVCCRSSLHQRSA